MPTNRCRKVSQHLEYKSFAVLESTAHFKYIQKPFLSIVLDKKLVHSLLKLLLLSYFCHLKLSWKMIENWLTAKLFLQYFIRKKSKQVVQCLPLFINLFCFYLLPSLMPPLEFHLGYFFATFPTILFHVTMWQSFASMGMFPSYQSKILFLQESDITSPKSNLSNQSSIRQVC